MNYFLLAVMVIGLSFTTIVNCSSSQICTDANNALVASAECSQAFYALSFASSDSLLCQGHCRDLVESVFEHCPNMVCELNYDYYFKIEFV